MAFAQTVTFNSCFCECFIRITTVSLDVEMCDTDLYITDSQEVTMGEVTAA